MFLGFNYVWNRKKIWQKKVSKFLNMIDGFRPHLGVVIVVIVVCSGSLDVGENNNTRK